VLGSATISFLILLLITIFVFKEGLPAFFEIGLGSFLFGTEWSLKKEEFGILPLILGSILVTLGTLILATPLGIACAIFLAEVAPRRVREALRPAIELLVGIPSVVYGLVGMIVLVPLIRQLGGTGFSLLAGVVVLTIMVLPTLISISEDSLRALPKQHKEGALALGATHWQAIWHVMLPAARSGIATALILGMARAIGETMAVYMVIGNAFAIPQSPLDPSRTLTSNIVGQMLEAASGSLHFSALFADGIVLLIIILIFNTIAFVIRKRSY
jgi:phosphate transport system permease protein